MSQEILDLSRNILIRFYQEQEKFLFRFVTYSYNKEIDPIKNSSFNWAYGPFTSIEEAEFAARSLYKEELKLQEA